jgi:hypothetical protein
LHPVIADEEVGETVAINISELRTAFVRGCVEGVEFSLGPLAVGRARKVEEADLHALVDQDDAAVAEQIRREHVEGVDAAGDDAALPVRGLVPDEGRLGQCFVHDQIEKAVTVDIESATARRERAGCDALGFAADRFPVVGAVAPREEVVIAEIEACQRADLRLHRSYGEQGCGPEKGKAHDGAILRHKCRVLTKRAAT